ncbi:MAG: zf-HC2 domain-containing protein [Lachnospiraceae bacterium]|nr:zf-HC2 domain-containing protein [Ruminococcus sp.]MCM1274974.1 zf-HC2 domain-containing protein [Lachnospiraceae bacterium]
MKCNIARDLLPLYAEGLCGEETARELEEHFAECEKCAVLKDGLPMPEGGEKAAEKEIKPFKRIRRRFKLSAVTVAALALVAATALLFLGGLIYGELFPESIFPSFSKIARNAEVRGIAGLLEKGDIDGFAEHLYGSDVWYDESDALIESFKAAYREELGGKNCKITNVATDGLYFDGREYLTKVTLEFDGESVTLTFRRAGGGYYVYADNDGGLKSIGTLGVLAWLEALREERESLSVIPEYFVILFSSDYRKELEELYRAFLADGSELASAYSALPRYDAERDALTSRCCLKFTDGAGNSAAAEFYAEVTGLYGNNGRCFSADMSTLSVINGGMSEEKLGQIRAILETMAK